MPYELLSGLANCLLNETIFKIVEGLTEIQQVTEKQLLQQRLKLLHRHRGNRKLVLLSNRPKNNSITNTAEKEALAKKPIDPNTETEKEQVLANHSDELKQADMNLILQLDQLVADQQSTLEKAGVPGFYSTSNPQEIKVQMYLLEFILKLGKESELNSLWISVWYPLYKLLINLTTRFYLSKTRKQTRRVIVGNHECGCSAMDRWFGKSISRIISEWSATLKDMLDDFGKLALITVAFLEK